MLMRLGRRKVNSDAAAPDAVGLGPPARDHVPAGLPILLLVILGQDDGKEREGRGFEAFDNAHRHIVKYLVQTQRCAPAKAPRQGV